MSLLAVDPGTTESGYVVLDDDGSITAAGVLPNEEILATIYGWNDDVAVERFEARGMSIGDDSVVTILWTGRFVEAAERFVLVKRSEVKTFLCGTQKAKDTNIRQALVDLIGPPGNKANPGPTYLVKSHAWAALGVAATVRKLERKDTTT
jgi:hypothetical protein